MDYFRLFGADNIDRMNVYLRNASRVALSLYYGLVFALTWAIMWPLLFHADHANFGARAVVIYAIIGGIAFGAIAGAIGARQWQEVNAGLGPLSNTAYRSVARAAIRGPIPTEPEIRGPALWLATHNLNRMSRWHKSVVVTVAVVEAVVAVVFAYEAATVSPWYLAQAGLFLYLSAEMVRQLWLRRHLERRIGRMRLGELAHM